MAFGRRSTHRHLDLSAVRITGIGVVRSLLTYVCQTRAWPHAATEGSGELIVVNSGDGRVRFGWGSDVVEQAFDAGWMLDPNGYLAPVGVMITASEDD